MLQTRYATQDDVKDIVALVQSAYRGESSRRGWTTEADLLDGQRTDVDEVSSLIGAADNFILIHQPQQLLASMHLARRTDHAYLGMFAVHPVMQGRGLGAQMLQRAEQIAFKEWNKPSMRMTVISLRTELIDWYRRHGYQDTGEICDFPYGEPRFGLPRRDDLVLKILSKSATF